MREKKLKKTFYTYFQPTADCYQIFPHGEMKQIFSLNHNTRCVVLTTVEVNTGFHGDPE